MMNITSNMYQSNQIARQMPWLEAGNGTLSGLLAGLIIVIVVSVLLLSQEDPEVGMAP